MTDHPERPTPEAVGELETMREALEEIVSWADAAERWSAGRVLTSFKQAEVNVWKQVGEVARAALERPHSEEQG